MKIFSVPVPLSVTAYPHHYYKWLSRVILEMQVSGFWRVLNFKIGLMRVWEVSDWMV